MRTVAVSELRQNFSAYLRSIASDGEPFTVTDRGRPVAVLAPITSSEDEYDALEAAGHLRAASADWSSFEVPSGAVSTAGSEALDELREERL